ncbi:MAG: hypothetical protein JW860_08315 [Sedimentisphaerales bacterium]|nr:hypothetical protein [Sedimentisphaerales bacterium]
MDAHLYNSLTEGDFGNGFYLCQELVEGDFWSRRLGCYCVYRGMDYRDDIDYEHIVAATDRSGEFCLPDAIHHQVETDYFYGLRRCSATGRQEQGTMAEVTLSLDAAGRRRAGRCNPVQFLTARVENGRHVRLYWWYSPPGQEVEPDRFGVFGDDGSGLIDYGQAPGTMDYKGQGWYSWVSEAQAEDGRYRYSVCTITAQGVNDGNRGYVEITIGTHNFTGIVSLDCGVG